MSKLSYATIDEPYSFTPSYKTTNNSNNYSFKPIRINVADFETDIVSIPHADTYFVLITFPQHLTNTEFSVKAYATHENCTLKHESDVSFKSEKQQHCFNVDKNGKYFVQIKYSESEYCTFIDIQEKLKTYESVSVPEPIPDPTPINITTSEPVLDSDQWDILENETDNKISDENVSTENSAEPVPEPDMKENIKKNIWEYNPNPFDEPVYHGYNNDSIWDDSNKNVSYQSNRQKLYNHWAKRPRKFHRNRIPIYEN
jgi:hypothetical protein